MTRSTLAVLLGAGLCMHAACDASRSDAEIAQEVREELRQEPELQGAAIDVTAVDGHVTLTGTVSSPDARGQAERVADGVAGVKEVLNTLEVAAGMPGLPPVGSPPRAPAEPPAEEAVPPQPQGTLP
jgi:hypothetical protein